MTPVSRIPRRYWYTFTDANKYLGQGANQSLEDIDLLIELLEKHNPSAQSPPTAILARIFDELEKARIPRSSDMVNKSRVAANAAVVCGVDACITRNHRIRELHEKDGIQEAMFGM